MHLKFLTGISYLEKKNDVVMEDVRRLSLHPHKSMENIGEQCEEE